MFKEKTTSSLVEPIIMTKMKEKSANYDAVVQKALRQIVHDVLAKVEQNGLIGDQHFYITFATNHPWVVLPEYLKEEYPSEMVIVLQYEFWDLDVREDKFSVNLYFDDINERITIPFSAILSFADPSAKFCLQFVADYDDKEEKSSSVEKSIKTDSNVVSLDDFRKK